MGGSKLDGLKMSRLFVPVLDILKWIWIRCMVVL